MKKIITLFLAIFVGQLSAQTFRTYTTDDGLINNSVNCLAIDANDDIWFGTQEGLSFFNGSGWTNYDINAYPDLISNNITALFVDRDGNLWIGTDFGLNKFDGNDWFSYTEDDGLADNRIKYINQDPDGDMWIANNDGISIFDGSTSWTSYTMADGLPFGGTNFVIFDANGKAFLGTPLAGVLMIEGTTISSISESNGLISNKVRSIAIDANGYKWIGTAVGISVFDQNNGLVRHHEAIFELPPPDVLSPIEDVQIDKAGRIWAGVYVDYLVSEGGISMYGGSDWIDYDVDDGLAGPVVRRLAIDSRDIVWIVTSTGVTKIGDLPNAIYEPAIDQAIHLFPNPTRAMMTMEVPEDLLGTTFQLFNTTGAMMKSGSLTNSKMNITIDNLADGFYFLSLANVYHRKVLIQR